MQIRLFKNWWLMTIKGILAIGFGIVMLIRKNPMIITPLAISFGVLVIVSGLLIITGSLLHRKNSPRWRSWLIEGLIDIIIGAIFVIKPQIAKAFFLYFMAIWAFITAFIQIITSFRMINYMDRWWTMLITGVFSVLFAILIFINPFYTRYNMGMSVIIGISCIIFGMIMVYLSRVLRDIYL
jgi:uncharacterized membrane protein HdeD (DUF308 family)